MRLVIKKVFFLCLLTTTVIFDMCNIEKNKMERNTVISFFVMDGNRYKDFKEKISELRISFNYVTILDIITELLTSLSNNKHPYNKLDFLDFNDVNQLYNTHFNNESKEDAKKNLLIFLNKLKDKRGHIDDTDFDYLLDFYFYYYCAVTFNKDWYFQPHMPISSDLSIGLENQTLIMKQILKREYGSSDIIPLSINTMENEYFYKLDSSASKEMFSNIMYYPVINKLHPRNLEVSYYKQIDSVINSNPSYVLCLFYTPN